MFPLPTGHTVVIATATKLDVSGNFGFETPVVGDGRYQSVPAYAAGLSPGPRESAATTADILPAIRRHQKVFR